MKRSSIYLLYFSPFFLFSCSTVSTHDLLITNGDCSCSEYVISDSKNRLTFEFTANYSLQNDMLTTILINVKNNSPKVLSFDHARVRVSSVRFAYHYNEKFIPFSPIRINPGRSEEITLIGRAGVQEKEEWHRIAGEKMTVTIKGIRLGNEEIDLEEVHFVPINPQLRGD